jgi:hypothetical protein
LNNPLHPGGGPLNTHSITHQPSSAPFCFIRLTIKNPEESHAQRFSQKPMTETETSNQQNLFISIDIYYIYTKSKLCFYIKII